jgi:hypothetical protein
MAASAIIDTIKEKISKIKVTDDIQSAIGNHVGKVSSIIRKVSDAAGKVVDTAGQVVETGASLITGPVHWLKYIQKNWLLILVLIAIIAICVVILYCSVCYYINRFTTVSVGSSLITLAKIVGNKTETLQRKKQELPLSVRDLPKI